MKRLLFAAVATVCLVAPAVAQQAAPLPVESMNCEQMTAEMMGAGQTMSSQLDPNFASDVQTFQDDMERERAAATARAAGTGAVCAAGSIVPGVGAACAAAQMAQINEGVRRAEQNRHRTDAMVGQVQNSMAGLDQNRLMALYQRFEAQSCQTPQ